jgi:hypothetical protein
MIEICWRDVDDVLDGVSRSVDVRTRIRNRPVEGKSGVLISIQMKIYWREKTYHLADLACSHRHVF